MAGDSNVNGNYGTQHLYGQPDNYNVTQVGIPSGPAGHTAEPASSMPAAGAPANDTEEKLPSKEEIGWFFVEQYYKTLCNEPSKLYVGPLISKLYYNKRSQFVSGDEAAKVLVAVGQKAISERIKELDIQDCKVRVLNVDSQESLKNILVQVIGEISNKAEPHRKFVQTFVLAEQPSGYYVLNDIFRYIALEEDEYENDAEANEEVAQIPAAPKPDKTTLTSSGDPAQQKAAAEIIDKKLEENVLQKPSAQESIPSDVKTNGHVTSEAPETQAEDAPAATGKDSEADDLSRAAAIEEVEPSVEKPRDPDPTPISSPPQAAKTAAPSVQAPAAPAKPAAPKTWASLVGRAAAPAAPTNGTTPTPAAKPAQTKSKAVPSAAKRSVTPPTSNGDGSSAQAQTNGNSEWQLADNKQRQNRPHSQSISSSQATVLGYVKNVTEKVDASILKSTLQTFGELIYFDVSRQKNCAFIEYADSAAYNAAVAANPHNIGGEQIFVEERRPRANAYGGNVAQRGGARGGRGGNENFRGNNQGRGGFNNKEGSRGGFNGRGGRGGAVPPKARTGQPQAA